MTLNIDEDNLLRIYGLLNEVTLYLNGESPDSHINTHIRIKYDGDCWSGYITPVYLVTDSGMQRADRIMGCRKFRTNTCQEIVNQMTAVAKYQFEVLNHQDNPPEFGGYEIYKYTKPKGFEKELNKIHAYAQRYLDLLNERTTEKTTSHATVEISVFDGKFMGDTFPSVLVFCDKAMITTRGYCGSKNLKYALDSMFEGTKTEYETYRDTNKVPSINYSKMG